MKTGFSHMRAGLLTLLLGFTAHAQATVWTIDAVLSGTQGGFGFSGFHDANGSDPMTGAGLGDISATASGTYDDVTGEFFGVFSVLDTGDGSILSTFTLAAPGSLPGASLIFSAGDAFLDSAGALAASFSDPLSVGSLSNALIGFAAGDQCCSGGADDPNSFVISGNTAVMSLWGWTGAPNVDPANAGLTFDYGMDLKIQFSTVPAPSVLYLFGLGLLILGISRARKLQSI